MEKEYFEKLLENNNALFFNDEILLFKDLELYNIKKNTSIYFKNLEEFLQYELNGKSFADIIKEKKEFLLPRAGSCTTSGLSGKMHGGFTNARGGGNSDGEGKTRRMYPAQLNLGSQVKTFNKTLKLFAEKYANANREYGATLDSDGFVSKHVQGMATSVSISGGRGEVVVHNHPSGGNFSKNDLLSSAMTQEKGVIAVGKENTYIFEKTKRFKAKEFIKAVSRAKWPVEYDYNKGADWWLRKNADTYGYKYSKVKTENI